MIKADQQQFIEDYKAVHDAFARYCESLCFGIMEPCDLMSDCVLVILEKYDVLKNNIDLLPYMIGIANNIIRKKIRRKKIVSFFGLDKATHHTASSRTDLPAELSDLYKALNQLSQPEKEAIILFEISGFSIKEVAQILNISEAAVKTKLHRSRKKLRLLLDDNSTTQATFSLTSKAGGIG